MVEGVEGLPSELNVVAFMKARILDHAKIPIIQSRLLDAVPRRISRNVNRVSGAAAAATVPKRSRGLQSISCSEVCTQLSVDHDAVPTLAGCLLPAVKAQGRCHHTVPDGCSHQNPKHRRARLIRSD